MTIPYFDPVNMIKTVLW